ncbi:hypothetical protein BO99DRAFT_14866 [Aspergillus violaceofuscus CBS 115571]|uniref:Uncharacterized protein n=1 Tax=Aspergillus violaceofuscus (strain CBS 115571) TaxID=1450538 RepID=A0A2V5H1J4_ASPV1|nr:hypothetical protein BO99DRAFT_14866 [Aspergillus violaceofuscus CBS 115571]
MYTRFILALQYFFSIHPATPLNPKIMASLINQAAWQPKARTRSLQVGPGPTPSPNEHEVVIKVAYAAVNPTDWKVSKTPLKEDRCFHRPAILKRV